MTGDHHENNENVGNDETLADADRIKLQEDRQIVQNNVGKLFMDPMSLH